MCATVFTTAACQYVFQQKAEGIYDFTLVENGAFIHVGREKEAQG
jgi:hypothetical protein